MEIKINKPEPFFFERSKKAVLLLHAYTGSANDVRLLGRKLERNGYTVYAPQFTGHATNRFEDIVEKGTPEIWLQDVRDATRFLRKKGYDQIAVFGLSMGGLMATRALEINSAYIGGGSFNSPIFNIGKSNVPAAFLNYYKAAKRQQKVDPKTILQGLEMIEPKMQQQLREVEIFTEKIQEDIGKIQVPYYIASSQKDELIDPMNGRVLADAVTNAPVDYHSFPDSTHVITVGPHREAFEESLLEFLSKLNWKEG